MILSCHLVFVLGSSLRLRPPVAMMICLASTATFAAVKLIGRFGCPLATGLPKPMIDIDLVLLHQELNAFAHLIGHAAAAFDDQPAGSSGVPAAFNSIIFCMFEILNTWALFNKALVGIHPSSGKRTQTFFFNKADLKT